MTNAPQEGCLEDGIACVGVVFLVAGGGGGGGDTGTGTEKQEAEPEMPTPPGLLPFPLFNLGARYMGL